MSNTTKELQLLRKIFTEIGQGVIRELKELNATWKNLEVTSNQKAGDLEFGKSLCNTLDIPPVLNTEKEEVNAVNESQDVLGVHGDFKKPSKPISDLKCSMPEEPEEESTPEEIEARENEEGVVYLCMACKNRKWSEEKPKDCELCGGGMVEFTQEALVKVGLVSSEKEKKEKDES